MSKKSKARTESKTEGVSEAQQKRPNFGSPFGAFAAAAAELQGEFIHQSGLISTDAAQRTVLQGDDAGRVAIWDTVRKERTWAGRLAGYFRELSFSPWASSDAALSPDGASFATASDKTKGAHGVKLHRATDGEVLWDRPDLALRGGAGAGRQVRFSPDGTRLSVCATNWRSHDDPVKAGPPCHVLDAATGQALHTVPACEGYYWNPVEPQDVAIHRETGGQIVDRGTGKVLAQVPIPEACVFSADGKTAFPEPKLSAVDLGSRAVVWQADVDELADMSVSWRPGYLSVGPIAYSQAHGRLLASVYQATANQRKSHFRGVVAVSPETGTEIGVLLPDERRGYSLLIMGDPDREYFRNGAIWQFGEQSGEPWLMLINVDEEDWLIADPDGLVNASSAKARELFESAMSGDVQKPLPKTKEPSATEEGGVRMYKIRCGVSYVYTDFLTHGELHGDYLQAIRQGKLSFYDFHPRRRRGDMAEFESHPCMSAKFVDVLRDNGITNFEAHPIKMDCPEDEGKYFNLEVQCKEIPLFEEEIEEPGVMDLGVELYFRMEDWGGEDLFTLGPSGSCLCTERVKRLVEKAKLKNVRFVEVEPVVPSQPQERSEGTGEPPLKIGEDAEGEKATKKTDAPTTKKTEAGPEARTKEEASATTALTAAARGYHKRLKSIAEEDAPLLTATDAEGRTPAILAAQKGKLKCLEVIAEACPDSLSTTTPDGATPLFAAADHGHADCVGFLLDAAPETISLPTNDGVTPAEAAANAGHDDCARLIAERLPKGGLGKWASALLKKLRRPPKGE